MADVLIVLNGFFSNDIKEYKKITNRYNKIIAVDGGYKFLKKITNVEPEAVIGDFDSLEKDSSLLDKFNGEFYEFDRDKDKTDGELAVDYCFNEGIKNIDFIGAYGGRIDQQYGNLMLLEYALEKNIKAKIIEPGIEAGLVIDKKIIKNKVNFTLSIFALSKEVLIKKLQGCKYELNNYHLKRASSRGISNLITNNQAVLKIKEGKLLYFICQSC